MVDCFVSSFRINYRNNQHFDICLQPNSPIIYHLAFVKGTYSIVKETSLRWWPKAEVLHPKAPALRHLFLVCHFVTMMRMMMMVEAKIEKQNVSCRMCGRQG